MNRFGLRGAVVALLFTLGATLMAGSASAEPVKRYVRYQEGSTVGFGALEGETIHELDSNFLDSPAETGKTLPLSSVTLLAPVEPRNVIAVGLNYQSHARNAQPSPTPEIFLKLPGSIIAPGESIFLPADADNVHFEAEMVLVIGKKAKNVPESEAKDYIFGVTCGNDVSARQWQLSDGQWFRAKASDTFGPLGPAVVTGLDYDNLLVQCRLNGETKQSQRTSDLIHDSASVVAFVSRYITLHPGDVIFTGTPGQTSAIADGDVVEVEVEGVGVLRNPVRAEAGAKASAASGKSWEMTADMVMRQMDLNRDGRIDRKEAPERLKPFFAQMDTNGDGGIDVGEAQAIADAMTNMGRRHGKTR